MLKHKLENPDGSRIDFADVSLESLGTHMLSGYVNDTSMKEAIVFILKANQLFTEKQDLTLLLNTSGGNCYDGFALIDVMEISRLPVRTIGLGNVMSMGVLLLAAGSKGKRVMTKNTQVMAHQFYGGSEGKLHELIASHKAELYLEQQFLNHFLKHSKMNEKQIRDIVLGPSDRWLSPAECKKYGLVDQIINELPSFNLPALQVSPAHALPTRRRARS
jgi:ATP-dependent Clp protease protease subunit